MYVKRNSGLGDWSDLFGDILNTGEQIFKDSRTPVITNPTLNLPRTPPFINPVTGQFLPASSPYTVPLMVGAGAVLLILLTRRK
jgi:hypothetical protein